MKKSDIDISIINNKELLNIFNELNVNEQKKILNNSFKECAKIIINQAKINFNSTKKNKSKTSYKDLNRIWKIEPIKRKDDYGVKFGVKYQSPEKDSTSYKYRWLEWGTDDRITRGKGFRKIGKRYTGKITATHFFFNAVDEKKQEAIDNLNDAIIKSLERTVRKYNK